MNHLNENDLVLITGGTGSFGFAFLKYLLSKSNSKVRIVSRDEKKQDELRTWISNKPSYADRTELFIADVRDVESLSAPFNGVTHVFHAAALKQVPSCEFFPIEAVKTNVLGTHNVALMSIRSGVKSLVGLSTDKAVYPINAMGLTKGLLEKTLLSLARTNKQVRFGVTRYGNVMGSRGSVIPIFLKQALHGEPLRVTNPKMTRFLMSLDESVKLIMKAFESANSGDLYVLKAPATTLDNLAKAVIQITNSSSKVEIIGSRHGEKIDEVLVSREEMAVAINEGEYYRVPLDVRDLNYAKYHSQGNLTFDQSSEFSSSNTQQLDVDQTANLLLQQDFVKRTLSSDINYCDYF